MVPEPQTPEPKRRRVNFKPNLNLEMLREPRNLAIAAFVGGLIPRRRKAARSGLAWWCLL